MSLQTEEMQRKETVEMTRVLVIFPLMIKYLDKDNLRRKGLFQFIVMGYRP